MDTIFVPAGEEPTDFLPYGVLKGEVNFVPAGDEDEAKWGGKEVLVDINQKFTAEATLTFPDPWAKAELYLLLRPRVNRRVSTSYVLGRPNNSAILAFAEFWQDGWWAHGMVRKLPSGNVEVVWTTAWTNTRKE